MLKPRTRRQNWRGDEGGIMRVRTRGAKAGLVFATVLLSGAGLTMATALPASASNGCYVMAGIKGDRAWAKGFCDDSDDEIWRKFAWSKAPDSWCLPFHGGRSWTHDRPHPGAGFQGMKACSP
ncbi:hypothetical protein ABZ322_27870 [Streptomyces sp. NPDC006129]|uniref:hypothetical protein n=1 Tax=Streptomyces sp. NPDC006129 TaxID=3155348 RepID=UPI00339E527E